MNTTARTSPRQRLSAERIRRHWSQLEVADQLGTTPGNVSRWERGITSPGPYFRSKLCELFGMSAHGLGLAWDETDDLISQQAPASAQTTSLPWNVPARRNPFFTGREDILAQLHTLLASDTTMLAQALTGLGGIGKTQTAIEYAYRHRDDYSAVLWVKADTREVFVSGLAALAEVLNLPEQEDPDQERVVQAVMRWLKTHSSWLLILDNVEEVTRVADVLPIDSQGRILLTTSAQATGTVAQHLDLDQMTLEEGTLFLLRRSKRIAPHAAIEEASARDLARSRDIAQLLGGLPLALDQAGAYIEETACSLTDYLERYYAGARASLCIFQSQRLSSTLH